MTRIQGKLDEIHEKTKGYILKEQLQGKPCKWYSKIHNPILSSIAKREAHGMASSDRFNSREMSQPFSNYLIRW